MKKEIEELKEFLETLHIHHEGLDVCFHDHLASGHIESLFKKALQSQTQDIREKVENILKESSVNYCGDECVDEVLKDILKQLSE